MKEIKTEIIINASANKVWEVLTNFEAYPNWNPFIIEILLEGTLVEGAQLQNTMLNKGKKNVFKPVVTQLTKTHRFEWLGKLPLGMFSGRHYFILEELDVHQTRLIHGEKFSGWLMPLLMRMIGEDTMKNFQAMNKALKVVAEK